MRILPLLPLSLLPTQCEDSLVPRIMHSLRVCIEAALPSAPRQIQLRRYVAQGYIGLFVEEDAAEWLREITRNFANDIKRHGMYTNS